MLTTVILTHNSQESLAQTLDSVDWSDECIVLDDASTDRTLEIARNHRCRILARVLGNDFAAQRNFALSHASGDWVLFVDSDEVVSPELAGEIRDRISRQGTDRKGTDGYFLRRQDMFLGRTLAHGETAHVALVRLGRKDAGIWKRPVHEYWDIPGVRETLQHPLYHTAHKNVAQFVEKINRYTTINARHMFDRGVRASVFSILGYPIAKFLNNYIVKLGYLDGTEGFLMTMLMSFHSFLTRAKLYLLAHGHTS